MLHVDARYNSDIPEPIKADFDVDGQLKLWSTMTRLDLEEIVAYFPRTNSYLVRAKSGKYYLSQGELEVFYDLGDSEDSVVFPSIFYPFIQ